jgi:hypothetical protein
MADGVQENETEHVARKEEMGNSWSIFVGKSEGNICLEETCISRGIILKWLLRTV